MYDLKVRPIALLMLLVKLKIIEDYVYDMDNNTLGGIKISGSFYGDMSQWMY